MGFLKKHWVYVLVLFSVVTAVLGFGWIGLLVSAVLFGLLYPPLARKGSRAYNLLLYFILSSCLHICLAAVCYLMRINYTVVVAIILHNVFVLGSSKLLLKNSLELRQAPLFNRDDTAAYGLATITTLAIAFFAVSNGFTVGVLREVTKGFDNAQHASLLVTHYDAQSYVYGKDPEVLRKLVYYDRGEYPKGWHMVNAVWWRGITQNLDAFQQPLRMMKFYYLTKLFWFWLLLAITLRSVLYLFRGRAKSADSRPLLDYSVLTIFTGFLSILYAIPVLRSGFGSFVLIPTYLIVACVLLYELKRNAPNELGHYLLLAALIVTGSAFTWLLALPVFAVALFCGAVWAIGSPSNIVTYLRKQPGIVVLCGAVAALSSLQCYFQKTYAVKVDNINDVGGITPISSLLVLLLVVTLVAGFVRYKVEEDRAIGYIIAPAGASAAAIYAYQMLTIGELRYFYTKVLGIGFFVVCFGCGVLALRAARTMSARFGFAGAILILACLASFLPAITNADISSIKYALGRERRLSPGTAQTIVDLVEQRKVLQSNFVVIKENNYEEDLVTTIFVNMLTRTYDYCQQQYVADLLLAQKEALYQAVHTCSKDRTVYVLGSSTSITKLKTKLQSPNIKVILTD